MGFSRPEHRWQSGGRGRPTRNRIASVVLAVGALLLVNTGPAMALTLTSSAFEPGGTIPSKYTCEGDDVSLPLAFAGVPAGTKSLALIVDDPDVPDPNAPKRVWVHWLVYNLAPDSQGLPENASGAGLPEGAVTGVNDWKRTSYGGPCPPIGRHRYFHKLYALDAVLPDLKQPTKADLLKAMEGHILEEAELIGTYQKN
jgi:Raf kinase inhibitor-like YbhB/YbcL family protein